MVTTHNVKQGTEEWHEARTGKFTASNAIKLLKYGRSQRARVSEERTFTNKYMQRGHDLEPEAIALYEEARQVKVERPGYLTNDNYPDCLFSPDGLTDTHVLEVKCFGEKRHNDIHIRNIPDEILAQVHFGMIMCELEYANLVLFNPDIEPKKALKIIKVKRDGRLIKRLEMLMRGN